MRGRGWGMWAVVLARAQDALHSASNRCCWAMRFIAATKLGCLTVCIGHETVYEKEGVA